MNRFEVIGQRREIELGLIVLFSVFIGASMSQPEASLEPPIVTELCPDIRSVLEMARQHFLKVHGREPRSDECLFDQEPPSELWKPAVLCCELLLNEAM
jgi:hypothetical protein